MNNEIQRKITSLTLMTIMLAGGMVIAAPGMEPAYGATPNLFVSAENAQFDNYMAGPQVIEVVVIDSDINETNESQGEASVEVNGNELRMVQAVDGNWYGYFADAKQAELADATAGVDGFGLDFGFFCDPTAANGEAVLGIDVGESSGFYADTSACNAGADTTNNLINVVREAKATHNNIIPTPSDGIGQIGLDSINAWPFIQVYDLTDGGNVVIKYDASSGSQTVTLTFKDADDFAGIVTDSQVYTQGAQVHAIITDLWLNIDPTDEDSWTFGTEVNSLSTNYQVFDENGDDDAAGESVAAVVNISSSLSDMMGDDVKLIIDANAQGSSINVLTLQNNQNSDISCVNSQDIATCDAKGTGGFGLIATTQPVTITETGPSTGIFTTFDESDVSTLVITDKANRGTSATIDYNDDAISILTGFSSATIDIQPIDDEWSSGEEIPIILIDGDANKNSRTDEDLELNNPDVDSIPSLSTGNPFTLGSSGEDLDAIFLDLNPTTSGIKPGDNPTLGTVFSSWESNAFNDGVDGTVTIVAGGVSTIAVGTPGTGYTAATGASTTTSGSGSGATVDTTLVGAIGTILINAGGTGNAVNDVLTVTGSGTLGTATVTALTGEPATYTLGTVTGTGYSTSADVATTTVTGSGTGLLVDITVTSGDVTAVAISSTQSGTGYAVGDTFTINTGSADELVTVLTVLGEVTTISLTTAGTGYTAATGASTTTSGSGSGATVDTTLVGALGTIVINAVGSGYVTDDTITIIGGSGTATGTVTVLGEIISISLTTGGTGYTTGNGLVLSGGTGSAGTVNIVASSGVIQPTPAIANAGTGYTDGDILTIIGSLAGDVVNSITVQSFSDRAIIEPSVTADYDALFIDLDATIADLKKSIYDTTGAATNQLFGHNLLNIDLRSIDDTKTYDVYLVYGTINNDLNRIESGDTTALIIATKADSQSLSLMDSDTDDSNVDTISTAIFAASSSADIGLLIVGGSADVFKIDESKDNPFVADFFTFGFVNDGLEGNERIANQIIRIEVEETGDDTGTFEGSLEYVMVNQINILDAATYTGLTTISDETSFIVIEDLSDEDAPRVNYVDLGSDGVSTQIADQEEAPSHSGIVSFDSNNYKTADTVTITLEDLDLNVDSDLIEIYTVVSTVGDANRDTVGTESITTGGFSISLKNGDQLGRLLDITFDDERWTTPTNNACATTLATAGVSDTGLGKTGFTLVETGPATGVFVGDFQIPGAICKDNATSSVTPTGLDIEVNYVDFRDASGEVIEVNDGAGVRATTGSISLDRTVYPVPFGIESDFTEQSTIETPSGRALFPIHQSGMGGTTEGLDSGEFITGGDLIIHVRVNDPDFDLSASGEDKINTNSTSNVGPVKISVIRGSSTVILGYAGGPNALVGTIDTDNVYVNGTVQFGPMVEIAPDAGIFETDITIRYTDGPASTTCPSTTDTWTPLNGQPVSVNNADDRFDVAASSGENYCILQGDILQVEYTDPADASGSINTVTDSATFDLRNGVLQSDKSVYIIGSDMILTLIEPDFDLDNDQAETYDLDLIEWDSDAAQVTMGNAGGQGGKFDPEPLNFRETGDSTGIFQIVIEIPEELENDKLERGEEIDLEYTDWGPSGSKYVGEEDEDVNLTIFTSNFGATVELDQKVYTWTDKVYITIVAPDHNFDINLIDEIGNTDADSIKVATRGHDLDQYKLVETGTDTGIFTGEVILTGFTHNADGDTTTGIEGNDVVFEPSTGNGPTDGKLSADDDDGLTISFEFSDGDIVVGSALIRWNIGEVQWLEASYPASGTGVVRVIDPDMNLDPEAVDNFSVDVWSDSDAGGIDLTVTETNEATGIYEGTVFFTVSDQSSGHRLRVAEGDTVTAEYEDNTLPDPYTTADELDINATTLIGTVVPPLERAPAANLRTVDAFGNSLDTVRVDQQVQISADLNNGQDREQTFAYLVQIQDGDGVTVSLAWITGSLSSGQQFSPALSWIPTSSGSYTATAFVWESVDNPTALSPPVSTTISVS